MAKSREQRKGSKSTKKKGGKKKATEDNATESPEVEPEVSEQPKHGVLDPRLLKSQGSEKEQQSKRQSRHHHHHYEVFPKEEYLYTEKFFVRPKSKPAAEAEDDTNELSSSSTDVTVKPNPIDKSGSHRKSVHEAVLSKDEVGALQTVMPEMSETNISLTPTSVHSSNSLDSFDNFNFTSDESGGKWRPDMTWINDDSESATDVKSLQSNHETKSGILFTSEKQITESSKPSQVKDHDSFLEIRRLLSLVAILGRFPFVIFKEPGTSFRCRMKATARKWDLYILTLFLGIVLILCSVSVVSIFISRIEVIEVHDVILKAELEQKYTYINFEKLLFQKHWLHITVFLMALLVAFVGNVGVIIYGDEIVNCVNEVGKSLYELKYDNASVGLWKLKFLHCFITALDVTALVIFVLTTFGGFKESLQLESILYLRYVLDSAFFHVVKKKLYLYASIYIVLAIELYAYFVVRNHFVFIIAICRSITNSAHGWNSRITHFFGIIAPTNRTTLTVVETFRKPLTHETLLKEHLIITKLVREISGCFIPVLVIFFSTRVLCICCQLFRASTALLFDLKVKVEGGNDTIQGSNVKYDPTETETIYEITYFLFTTLLGMFVVSSAIAEVGRSVMNGFEPVRRYGLLLADSLKGRKFVMSLFMSFNAKEPHVVNPGKWFFVDKGLIVAIVGSSLLLFSIMIQFNVVNLVATPIVLPCPDNPTQLCIRTAVKNPSGGDLNNSIELNEGVTFQPQTARTSPNPITTTTTTTTTTTPTTTTARPVCPDAPDPTKFKANEGMDIIEKTKYCGLYCPFTRVFRMIPFDMKGENLIEDMTKTWNDQNKTIGECIVRPYRFVAENTVKFKFIYDCFGNCYNSKTLDEYKHFGFSLGKFDPSKTTVQITSTDTNFTPTKKCYSDHTSSSDIFDPLEVCGFPYPLVNEAFDYQTPAPGPSDLIHEALKKVKNNEYPTGKFDVSNPKCNKTNKSTNLQSGDLAIRFNFNLSIGGAIHELEVIRPIPFSFVYKNKVLPIPLKWQGKVYDDTNKYSDESDGDRDRRLFGYPYTYMHPLFLDSSTSDAKSSFGFFDCFGEKLDEFDDCGGLPFSVWDKTLRSFTRPKKTIQGRGPNTKCWDSPFKFYTCGIYDAKLGEIDRMCQAWDDYKDSYNASKKKYF